MTDAQWFLIGTLALGAYSIRFLGLVSGQLISDNKHLSKFLADLPGCLIVALIVSSLAGADPITWTAAAIAFVVALISNHVVITMIFGFIAIFALKHFFI
ncbi:AzlD domain-containing protein [Kiloniella majae]|uniref:AzlD domain-containing protein n=1 Tax=Kiloniella majae TaxID=1938558 RepID=UPI000A27905D|nr:AzlD domain-containing protein [Kiloniella majae]